MGWLCTLLYYCFGHLLLKRLECEVFSFESMSCLILFVQSLAFPMLSTALYAQNGTIYNQDYVFSSESGFSLNQTALNEIGLPAMTGSNIWSYLASNLAVCLLSWKCPCIPLLLALQIGGMIMHCALFWGPSIATSVKQYWTKSQTDPHWKVKHLTNLICRCLLSCFALSC